MLLNTLFRVSGRRSLFGAIQVLRNDDGVTFLGGKRYEGVRFNVISITRGLVGSNSQEKSVT